MGSWEGVPAGEFEAHVTAARIHLFPSLARGFFIVAAHQVWTPGGGRFAGKQRPLGCAEKSSTSKFIPQFFFFFFFSPLSSTQRIIQRTTPLFARHATHTMSSQAIGLER